MTSSIIRVLLLCAMAFVMTSGQADPTVTTNLGRMFGRVQRFGNRFVYQFLGIRYAVAPIGRLRFKKPVPRGRWPGTLDASRYGPSCAQLANTQWLPNRGTTEDCLLLNIYVPRTLTPNATKSVMVWIHGGGFVAGQGMGNDGSNLALTGDVIVVTINYRLDVFGFLSTGDNNSLGNYGVWDMLLAIRFVKDNIAAFGGNPNSITIFGESGGGYAVGLLSLSPLSQGLFQRAICESGVGISPRAIAYDHVNFTRRVSDNLGCTTLNANGTLDTDRFMTCLRQKNTNDILQASATSRTPPALVWRLEIAPTIDGEIIPARPEFLISRQNTHFYNPMPDIDFMAGVNNAEGSLVFWPLRNYQRQLNFNVNQGIPTRVLCDNIAPSLADDYYNGSVEISQGMCQLYTTDQGDQEQGRQVVNLYGDMMFVAPTVMSAMLHSRNNNGRSTYMYLFSQQPRPNSSPRWFVGAGHGAELAFVFGRRVINPSLSINMMEYWANFSKFGNPNGLVESRHFQWEQFDGPQKNYIDLGPTIQPRRDLWPDRVRFFTQIVPTILDRFPRLTETTWTTPSTRTTITGGREPGRRDPNDGNPSRGQGQGQGRTPASATSGNIRYLGNDIAYPRGGYIDDPGERVTFLRRHGTSPIQHKTSSRGGIALPTAHVNYQLQVTYPTGHTHYSGHVTYPTGRTQYNGHATHPTGRTHYSEQVTHPTGRTHYSEQVTHPTGRTHYSRNSTHSTGHRPSQRHMTYPTGQTNYHGQVTYPTGHKHHQGQVTHPTRHIHHQGQVTQPTRRTDYGVNVTQSTGHTQYRGHVRHPARHVDNGRAKTLRGHVTYPLIPLTYSKGHAQALSSQRHLPYIPGHVSIHYAINVSKK